MTPTYHLYGEIGIDPAASLAALTAFLEANAGKDVDVFINSPGGIAVDGAAMVAAMQRHGRVTVHVVGLAASAASLAVMGAQRRLIHRDALVMIHEPSAVTWGTAEAHRQGADTLDKLTGTYAAAYARATGHTPARIAAWMAAETWMTAQEAVDLKFCDGIEDDPAQGKPVAAFDYRRFRNPPRALVALATANGWAKDSPGETQKGNVMFSLLKPKQGEPPAQLLAGVSALMKANSLPQGWADLLAMRANDVGDVQEHLPLFKALAKLADPGWTDDEARAVLDGAFAHAAEAAPEAGDPDGTMAIMLAFSRNAETMRNFKARVAAGTDPYFLRGALDSLKPQRETGAVTGGVITIRHDWTGPRTEADRFADALAAKIDSGHTPTIGRELASMSLSDMMLSRVKASGHRVWGKNEAARFAMTHSTSDFPLILENALGKTVARRLMLRQPDILRAASRRDRPDYRESNNLSLSAIKTVAEIGEGGEIPHSTMEEKGEKNPVPRHFGGMFRLTTKAMVNDDLGVFQQAAQRMAEGCVTVQRNVLLAPLLANSGAGQTMADGNPLFHTSHGNLAASGAVLSTTSLSIARTAMRKQKGLVGEVLAIEPWALVVPAELETAAQQLIAQIQATKVADANPFGGQLELIVEPGLTSATAWYLIANPAAYEGLVWATLDGATAPRIESREGWETLTLDFRVVWDLDAAFVEHRTWYRNPGA